MHGGSGGGSTSAAVPVPGGTHSGILQTVRYQAVKAGLREGYLIPSENIPPRLHIHLSVRCSFRVAVGTQLSPSRGLPAVTILSFTWVRLLYDHRGIFLFPVEALTDLPVPMLKLAGYY